MSVHCASRLTTLKAPYRTRGESSKLRFERYYQSVCADLAIDLRRARILRSARKSARRAVMKSVIQMLCEPFSEVPRLNGARYCQARIGLQAYTTCGNVKMVLTFPSGVGSLSTNTSSRVVV